MKREKITFVEKIPIDKYRARAYTRTVVVERTFIPAGTSLLYGYTDRYNVVTIALDTIVKREEV